MAWIRAVLGDGGSQYYSWIPVWTVTGSGWTDTAWGKWGVGRNNGTNYIGTTVTTVENLNGFSYLRIIPDKYGWSLGTDGSYLKIYINNIEVFSGSRTEYNNLDINISSYSTSFELKIVLSSGKWGYTTMYCDRTLYLHNGNL